MLKSASFSACRAYRYSLWRSWGIGQYAMIIGLNPSTADETLDDPTIHRCINFAKNWGYAGLAMTNLFAFRATDPDVMKSANEPIGADNNAVLLGLAKVAGIVVAAWGNDGVFMGRDKQIKAMLPDLHYLKLNKTGQPAHPLYLKADLLPRLWI